MASESPTSLAGRSTSFSARRRRNVDRIEIADAASLGIAGLSGQVANVILKASRKASGQFEYDPGFRAHFTRPEFLAGSVSYTGETGPVDYTLSVRNNNGRGGFGGPIRIFDSQPCADREPKRGLSFRI